MSAYVTLKSGYRILMAGYYIVMSRYNISITLYWQTHVTIWWYRIDIEHSNIRMAHASSTYISQYSSVSKGLYIAQIQVLQNCQQQKHFGRFNKMESKIGLRHMLFEQHVALPSLTFISSCTKMSYCDVNMLYHDIILISWQCTRRSCHFNTIPWCLTTISCIYKAVSRHYNVILL